MKAFLMHPARHFDVRRELPHHEPMLRQDLGLAVLTSVMADGDEFVLDIARKALLQAFDNDLETILYRQAIWCDSVAHPDAMRRMYALTLEAIEGKKKSHWSFYGNYPSSILHGSIDVLHIFMDVLTRMKSLADLHAGQVASPGLKALFAMLRDEFSEAYFAEIHAHLGELKFRGGLWLSARLGPGNEGLDYILRRPSANQPRLLLQRLLGRGRPSYTFRIGERDEAGARAVAVLRDRGINGVANALAQSMDHMLGFFETLRAELAFYIGCLNLHDRLKLIGAPATLPRPCAAGSGNFQAEGLYDPCLALSMGHGIVGNGFAAGPRRLVIITGANQGGKSSFLRAIGLAQMMTQSGMFVAAETYVAELCTGLFTHFKREEDASLTSGRLDEELARVSVIADEVSPNGMLLFNESFASTNEREGAEIARQIVSALKDRHIRVWFVTHLYAFARGMYEGGSGDAMFLRAERLADGTRTFRLIEGEPLETSYGEDLYREVFENAACTSTERAAVVGHVQFVEPSGS